MNLRLQPTAVHGIEFSTPVLRTCLCLSQHIDVSGKITKKASLVRLEDSRLE